MNPTTLGLLAAGGAVGGGAAILGALLVPSRPDLLAALAPASPAAATSDGAPAASRFGGIQARIETALASTRLTTPDVDLRVIDMRRGEYLLTRIALAAVALLIGPIYALIFTIADLPIPAAIPAGIGVGLSLLTWAAVPTVIANKAEMRRGEMRHSLVAFLQLIALHRAAGAGTGAAVDNATTASDLWTFRRLAAATAKAARAGRPAWHGVGELAEEMGVDELADLSAITATAGTQGAAIYDTLLARATSLRAQLQTDQLAAAQVASGRMSIPKALLSMATMAFLIYPAIVQLVAT